MRFGPFEISVYNHGYLRLDGGAMFGTVPKAIWSGLVDADGDNRIQLATRSLLIEAGDRTFMVDAGNPDVWPEKLRRIYDIQNLPMEESGRDPASITDIILSHLHFDHSGGITQTRPEGGDQAELRFPNATLYVQADNYELARHPNPRERASYLRENIQALKRSKLVLTRGSQEIHPGIWVHQSNGHTRGLQWVEVRDGQRSIAFPSDMIPTSHHLPLAFTMAYDMSAELLLEEKTEFLKRAVAGKWIVVFPHDAEVTAGRVGTDEKGRYILTEQVPL
jgi:glyoxylase-like metal-dependent hydrolase (beta-lactamase superfamily II)